MYYSKPECELLEILESCVLCQSGWDTNNSTEIIVPGIYEEV